MSGHLLWSVFVDRFDEELWRDSLGQVDINAWCAEHGWDAKEIVSGSVAVHAYRDGRAEVVARRFLRGADGKRQWTGCGAAQVAVASPLRRSLPEGVGTVIRP